MALGLTVRSEKCPEDKVQAAVGPKKLPWWAADRLNTAVRELHTPESHAALSGFLKSTQTGNHQDTTRGWRWAWSPRHLHPTWEGLAQTPSSGS